jgi:hypothetical protein
MRRGLLGLFAVGVLAALANAEDQPAPAAGSAPAAAPPETAAPAPPKATTGGATELPRYTPRARGAPRLRIGAGTRSVGGSSFPAVEVLSPESVGLTLLESPSLYWHLSAPTDARIDFTLIDESSVAPLVEQTLAGPFEAGIHRIDLGGLGVRLAPGAQYQWFVALVPDPEERSADVVAGGGVERTDPAPLRDALAQAPESEQVQVLAREGIWYDAIDALSRRIERAPADPQPREQRASLLEQVGLARIAAAERAGPAKP